LAGGLSSAILEWCCDTGNAIEMHRIGLKDRFTEHGSIPQLRKDAQIDINSLFNLIVTLLAHHAA
jgi:1-deoxy-D-xylulose-5-phosphate synthase